MNRAIPSGRKEYRVVRDHYSGFEVQARRWWFPFWLQVGINTHSSVERAEAFARQHAAGGLPWRNPVVKYLGQLPEQSEEQS